MFARCSDEHMFATCKMNAIVLIEACLLEVLTESHGSKTKAVKLFFNNLFFNNIFFNNIFFNNLFLSSNTIEAIVLILYEIFILF